MILGVLQSFAAIADPFVSLMRVHKSHNHLERQCRHLFLPFCQAAVAN